MVRGLWPANAPPDWKLPTAPEMVHLQKDRVVSMPVCATKVRSCPASANQGHSTASWHSHYAMLKPTHLYLSHLLLLAQNLSSKQIVPTDNM